MVAQEGHTELVKALLVAKADINAADNTDGVTPLWMAAAQEGHTELVKLLLAAKADINAASAEGRTPLFMAAQEGHTEIVKLLLAARSVLADDSDDPVVIVRQTVDQILAVLANKDHSVDQRVRQIEEIAYDRFDFATISRLALARRWKGFSPEQREEFVEQYKIQLSRRYGTRITRYEQEKVEILGSRIEPGGDVTVRTRIEGGSADGIEVNYRLRKKDGPWLVIDVIIEGVSLVSSDRSQFAEILGRGGPSELLKQMREKNLRLRPENSSREAGSSGPGQTSE
jgi:phospholipid transport system substrate-binding protein